MCHVGDLLVGKFFQFSQHQHFPQFERQRLDQRAYQHSLAITDETRFRVVVLGCPMLVPSRRFDR